MSSSWPVDQVWQDFKATGDPETKDHLVEVYTPLVRGIAAGVRSGLPTSVEVADLVSDGLVGLLDAIEKFEPERGLAFQTYATGRIRGAIVDGLRASDWAPRSVRANIRAVGVAVADLERRYSRTPTRTEVAAELLISPVELDKTYADISYTRLLSLDAAEAQEAPALDSADGSPCSDDDVPDGFVAAVRDLSEQDQIVVALYYWDRLTQNEIAQVLGVSESRVSQIRQHASLALRRKLLNQG